MYDTVDIIRTATGRALVELLCHHTIIIVTYNYVLYQREYVAYCAAFLFCETNSIFLHSRQIYLFKGVPKTSLLFRINAFVNYGMNFSTLLLFLISLFNSGTFLVYRIWNCFWLLSYMYDNFDKMDAMIQFLMIASVPLITIVQIPLLYRIVFSDWFKTHSQKSKLNFD